MAEPKVRLKRDDGSSYPAWKRQSVGDMTVELTDYKQLSCGLPLLTSARTGLMFQDEYRSKSSTENDNTLFSVVPRGAVTYRHMSDDNIFHFNINDLVDAGLVSKEYPVFTTVNENSIKLLVEYLNSSTRFLEFCKAQKKGGTRTRLYFNVLKDFELLFPCPAEQRKIADFLAAVDEVIVASEQEVANLETQKKAVMKKVFSQEVRFKREDGTDFPEWVETLFLSLIDEIIDFRGRTPKKLGMDWAQYKTDHLALSAINVKKGYIDFNVDPHYGDNALFEKWMSGRELRQGQVLFTTEAPMGNVAQVPDDKPYILSQRTIAFNVKVDLICDDFLAHLLLAPDTQKRLYELATGGTAQGVSQKSLAKLNVYIPTDIEEQRLIAAFLSDFDEAIAAAKKELELWKELKKGLLQQMFV